MIFIAGNLAWQTEVVSFLIFVRLRSLNTRGCGDCLGGADDFAGVIAGGQYYSEPRRIAYREVSWLIHYAAGVSVAEVAADFCGLLLTFFILIIPLVWIFVTALSDGIGGVIRALAEADMLHAIWLTVIVALITVPVNLIFGTLLAWLVTRFRFPAASYC